MVKRFALLVFWREVSGNVESCQSGHAAEHIERQNCLVHGSAESDRVKHDGRSRAKRDLLRL